MLALSADAIYLAFPWFFLLLHLLPRTAGLISVAVVTAAAVAGFAWHQQTFTAAMVIGPALGAAVAIVTVFGYQALQAESRPCRPNPSSVAVSSSSSTAPDPSWQQSNTRRA